jgi:hypothetical protein
MAYQNLTLRNIAGEMTATFNDNRMRASLPPEPEVGPRLFVTGLAKRGLAYEVFRHRNVSETFLEFSPNSEIARIVSAAKDANGAIPLLVSRIASKADHFMIKREIDSSFEKENYIVIKPLIFQEADDTRNIRSSAEQLKMVLMPYVEGNVVRQRVLLAADSNTNTFSIVYDSERILRTEGDLLFDVEINVPVGEFLLTPAAFESTEVASFVTDGSYDLAGIKALSELTPSFRAVEALSKWEDAAGADILHKTTFVDIFDSSNTDVLDTLGFFKSEVIQGSAKEAINNCERYASNEIAYDKLEFENVDFIYCEKCYADTPAVSLSASDSLGEQLQWAEKSLGYFWKFIFNGKPYMFMFNESAPFTSDLIADYSHNDIAYSFSADQKKVGNLLNLVEMNIHAKDGTTTPEVESFFNEKGLIECHVTIAPVGDSAVTVETPFCTMVIAASHADLSANTNSLSVRLRPSLVDGGNALSTYCLDSQESLNTDPFVLSHYELVGDLIPEAVMARLLTFPESGAAESVSLVASNEEVREVSFLQQAAQAAYKASTNYSQTIALVPTTPPPASHTGVSTWAGNPASYEVDRSGNIVVVKDGTGILGTKLLAGSTTYRDGAAFGGVILTNGTNLPNEIPYGIDDTDEALDGFGNPIDLGKHAVVIGAWGFIEDPQNAQINRGSRIRTGQRTSAFVNAAPLIAGVLGGLAPGEEPIGPIRGVIPGILPQQRTPRAVLDNLAALRIAMIDQTGVLSSIYTAALRTSDYSKISSIMSANAILQQVRALCGGVIGTAYKDEQIASLSQQVDGVMRSMVRDGYAQSIDVRFSASRLDRINGVLRTSVRFVPPLSLEAVTIELTLEAPASGINA